uniref:hypothetical protein n=1 Tax=Marinobacterium profundum TaxID=1714300 RepID=UPI0008373BEC|nr:hypothetical protein [Marinobacterium profundum]
MIITTYEAWCDAQRALATDTACDECESSGWIECDLGHEHKCDTCESKGHYLSLDGETKLNLSHGLYFHAAIADIKAMCLWTRRDFLAEVGPFVRSARGYDKPTDRSNADDYLAGLPQSPSGHTDIHPLQACLA